MTVMNRDKKNDLNMRRAEVKDTAELVEFAEDCFGEAYTFEPEMRSFIENDNNRLYVVDDEDRIQGAVLFLNDSKETIMEDMEVTSDDFDRISRGKPILHHKFSIIRDDLRGKGMMTDMLSRAISELETEGRYGAIFTQGWIKDGEIPMEGIFRRMGYSEYKRQIRPWWKFSDRTCNICGGRCKCDAMVYYRPL